jgi:hypothetical protein
MNLDESLDTPAQLAQLTGFVNRLAIGLANAEAAIYELGVTLERARAEVRDGDAQTLAEAGAALRRFADQLNRAQVLDLRYAIAGVAISGVGAVLSLCT